MSNLLENITKLLLATLTIFLGVLGILAIKSFFEDDSSKIVSKKGQAFLSDDVKMKDINNKISQSENDNHHRAVVI